MSKNICLFRQDVYLCLRIPQNNEFMKIPDDLLKKWTDLRTFGDGVKIAESSGITENDVSRAFKDGECSDTVFVAIAGFYKEREEKVKEFL